MYASVILAYNGVEVELQVPRSHFLLSGGIIMCRFVDEGVFGGMQYPDLSYSAVQKSAEILHAMSPNTVYPDRVSAVQDKSLMRDFANHFRGKAFRDVYEASDTDIFSDGYVLHSRKTLKRAPAYRINYSRLVVSLLRTLQDLGSHYVYVDGVGSMSNSSVVDVPNPAFSTTYNIYKVSGTSPLRTRPLYIPDGIWMFNRCGECYIATFGPKNLEVVLPQVFSSHSFSNSQLHSIGSFCMEREDLPLEALALAIGGMDGFLKKCGIAPIANPKDLAALRLNGSNFDFQPSMADVVGYADYYFDMVKRMDIQVDVFKNAVFDYGTNIDTIVNDTYDLYPQYRNGALAFQAAIDKWKMQELLPLQ